MILGNIFSLIVVFCAFCLLFVVVPFTLMGHKFYKENLLYNVMSSLTVGSFVVIFLVYILAAFKMIRWWSLLLGILLICAAAMLLFYRQRTRRHYESIILFLSRYLKKLYKRRFIAKGLFQRLGRNIKTFLGRMVSHPFQTVTFLLGFGTAIYMRAILPVTQMYYSYSDEYMHTDWVAYLLGGKIFVEGLYPYGMQNMLAALSSLFGLNLVTVVHFFGVACGIFTVLGFYLLLIKLFRSQAAISIAFMLYTMSILVPGTLHSRQAGTLPQETAGVFLLPMAVFFLEYLRTKQMRHMVFTAIAFALTLTIHFYVTITALILLFVVFITHVVQVFKGKMLLRILICGILAVIIAISPFAIGIMGGYKWHVSMGWALELILPGIGYALVEDTTGLTSIIEENVNDIVQIQINSFDDVVNALAMDDLFVAGIVAMGTLLLLAMALYSFTLLLYRPHRAYAKFMLSIALYYLVMVFLYVGPTLGFPQILDAHRCATLLAFGNAIAIGFVVELLLFPFMYLPKRQIYTKIAGTGLTALVLLLIYQTGLQEYGESSRIQYNAAILAYYEIVNNFEKDKWCIVSSSSELCMVRNLGWHYELSDFVYELAEHEMGSSFYLSSTDLFFFVEKRPLMPYALRSRDRLFDPFEPTEVLGPEDWEQDILPIKEDLMLASQVYTRYEYRRVVMGKAYKWMEEYRKYYPEITVFYEDDEFVVYRLHQNDPYALNNLSIDFGYN